MQKEGEVVDGVVFHRTVRRAQRRQAGVWFGGDKEKLFREVEEKIGAGQYKPGKYDDTYQVDVQTDGFYLGTVKQAGGDIDLPVGSARVLVWGREAITSRRNSRVPPPYRFAVVKVEADVA